MASGIGQLGTQGRAYGRGLHPAKQMYLLFGPHISLLLAPDARNPCPASFGSATPELQLFGACLQLHADMEKVCGAWKREGVCSSASPALHVRTCCTRSIISSGSAWQPWKLVCRSIGCAWLHAARLLTPSLFAQHAHDQCQAGHVTQERPATPALAPWPSNCCPRAWPPQERVAAQTCPGTGQARGQMRCPPHPWARGQQLQAQQAIVQRQRKQTQVPGKQRRRLRAA